MFKEWNTLMYNKSNNCVQIHDMGVLGQGFVALTLVDEVRMKKTQDSSKWLFWDNLIPEIKSKAPNQFSDITFE